MTDGDPIIDHLRTQTTAVPHNERKIAICGLVDKIVSFYRRTEVMISAMVVV